MKSVVVFKLDEENGAYNAAFSPHCQFSIDDKKKSGPIFLNFEQNLRRIVGMYHNLRHVGNEIIADIELSEHAKPIGHRFGYGISGSVAIKNQDGEAMLVKVQGLGATMESKS